MSRWYAKLRAGKSSPWKHPLLPIDLRASSRHYVFSRTDARFVMRSNASRQNVFYCVHAQETFIINLDHDSLLFVQRSGYSSSLFQPPAFFRSLVFSFPSSDHVDILGKIASCCENLLFDGQHYCERQRV